ncbi:unnamed protein product [Brassica oleracea var. botrytis]
MKKTTQAFLFLLRLLLLICLVFQVRVTEARIRVPPRTRTFPSPPCRAAPRGSGVTGIMNTQCRTIRRPPSKG